MRNYHYLHKDPSQESYHMHPQSENQGDEFIFLNSVEIPPFPPKINVVLVHWPQSTLNSGVGGGGLYLSAWN